MTRALLMALLLLTPGMAYADTVWCSVSNNTVTACSVNQQDPSWVQVDKSDPLYQAFYNQQAAIAAAQSAFPVALQLTSTGSPTINATYYVDTPFLAMLNSNAICSLFFAGGNPANSLFCNKTNKLDIYATDGNPHTFSLTNFKDFFLAVNLYIDGVNKSRNNPTLPLPPTNATIN